MTGSEYQERAEALWGKAWKSHAAAWHNVALRTIERWVSSSEDVSVDVERSIIWASNQGVMNGR